MSSHKFSEYLIGIRRRCTRLKHKVPPLRFASVGMTDRYGEFVGHPPRSRKVNMSEMSEYQVACGVVDQVEGIGADLVVVIGSNIHCT